MVLVGYCRVSRADQHPDAQAARLRAEGCELIFTDLGESGARASRPEWDRCLSHLRQGDTLVAVRLDRIGRSLSHLIQVTDTLRQRGVDLRILDQQIDTGTASGRLVFHVLGALSEFERGLLIERTRDGLAAAKARHGGKLPPRGPSISADKIAVARQLYARGDMPAAKIAEVVGISRATLYRALPTGGRGGRPTGQMHL